MSFWASLRRLWRHPRFRRLIVVRILTQGGDATLQVGMASYILFNPQAQPDAASIATMLAVTLLPFTVVGPFVSVVLDRVRRRNVIVAVDCTRAVVCALVIAVVLSGIRGTLGTVLFFALLLVAMSLNRFLLAGLAASLPHTIDDDEYLLANSVMPVVGPVGALLAGVGLGARIGLVSGAGWSSTAADAVVFAIAAVLFCGSVATALGFRRDALGPAGDGPRTSLRDVVSGLIDGLRELRRRPAAGWSLGMIGSQRVAFGVVQIATILMFRNLFHPVTDTTAALADIGIWAGLTGAGFLLASLVAPILTRLAGLRRGIVVALAATAVVQLVPGSIFTRPALFAAALLLGLCAQVLKIDVDTVVQTHVDDAVKGRVFVLYDMIFNLANVIAGGLAVLVLPVDGASLPVFFAVAVIYVGIGLGYLTGTRRTPVDTNAMGPPPTL